MTALSNALCLESTDDSESSPKKQKSYPETTKIIRDPVHGEIPLHPVCVAIVDTPQFQRLRHIKQTGVCDYIYPGAIHNRFGHSLGVCYLATKFLQELKERQPELSISDTDILCVAIAGLCHDLGHGPYSHTWEIFMKKANSINKCENPWKHENVSVNLLDYLIEDNNLSSLLLSYGIGSNELCQIKDYIIGAKPECNNKAYLSQIVNNDESGLDVDKWDYFMRDCLFFGLPSNFEYDRLMQNAKVFCVNGKTQICFRDKVLESVYNIFRTRSHLHKLAYQHKKVNVFEQMYIDAFLMADGKVTGPDGNVLQFWEWSMLAAYSHGKILFNALEKFSTLTDDLLHVCIKLSCLPELSSASKLLKSMDQRSCENNCFYQYIGTRILPRKYTESEIMDKIVQYLPEANGLLNIKKFADDSSLEPVREEDICVVVKSINWGKGPLNPVEFVHFYTKENTCFKNASNLLEISVLMPRRFEEVQLHVICRRSDNFAYEVTRWCFEKYAKCLDIQNNGHV